MKTVCIALFVDGDNGFEDENYYFVSESYMYAKHIKIFEHEEDAIQYLKDKIIKHYKNKDDAKEEINEFLNAIKEKGFYQDVEMDTYIIIKKYVE